MLRPGCDAARATQTRQIRSSDRLFRPGSARLSDLLMPPIPMPEADAARRPIVRRQWL